jgi:hypothetical protein
LYLSSALAFQSARIRGESSLNVSPSPNLQLCEQYDETATLHITDIRFFCLQTKIKKQGFLKCGLKVFILLMASKPRDE